jgi:hypothetical protein
MQLLAVGQHSIRGEQPWKRIGVVGILILAIFATFETPARGEANKSILFLNSYGPDFAPYNFLTVRLRNDLASQYGGAIDYYDVSLASARYVGAPGSRTLVRAWVSLREDVRDTPEDIIG